MADIEPLRRGEVGLAAHRFQTFDATVDRCMTPDELENPTLWVNVCGPMNPGDEIRVRSFDDSFVARLYVTYTAGTRIRIKTVSYTELDPVDYNAENSANGFYEIKQRGPKKWCVLERASGTVVKELIPTQLDAMREMSDLEKALAR